MEGESAQSGTAERRRSEAEPRRSRRLAIPGVLVAIDAPTLGEGHWVVDAIDLNADGLGLVLPPELAEGTPVELTLKLDDGCELVRLPARVRHQVGTSGGVVFGAWPESDRLRLLELLVRRYERGD